MPMLEPVFDPGDAPDTPSASLTGYGVQNINLTALMRPHWRMVHGKCGAVFAKLLKI